VWYSTIYPSFQRESRSFEQRDPALAKSFNTRYAIWLAVHSLLLQQEASDAAAHKDLELPEGAEENFERLERCRIARMSAMIAVREVRELKTAGVESD
jgi:hypothetical protein